MCNIMIVKYIQPHAVPSPVNAQISCHLAQIYTVMISLRILFDYSLCVSFPAVCYCTIERFTDSQ